MSKISVGEFFTVALISGGGKVYGQEGGREYQDFPSKIFCLTVPKIPVGNSLLLPYFQVPKKFGQKGGEYQDNPSNFFCLTVSKITVGEFLLLH